MQSAMRDFIHQGGKEAVVELRAMEVFNAHRGNITAHIEAVARTREAVEHYTKRFRFI